jgi:HTH-type transcriptional regulator/antitoxin HigA
MTITTEIQYHAAVLEFKTLAGNSQVENRERLIELRDALDNYEVAAGQEPPQPTSLAGRMEVEMYRLRMKQVDFAAFLGITTTRLSELLNGRRKPNLDLIKRLHTGLNIPGDELLKLV